MKSLIEKFKKDFIKKSAIIILKSASELGEPWTILFNSPG
jgi:hypothetical protein